MGANDKPAATFHPGTAKSGVTAVLAAADANTAALEHAQNLQAAVDEIRALATHWADSVPGQPFARRAGKRILAALDQHHV